MFIITPIYVYALIGLVSGWAGGRITAPSGLIDWNPEQHTAVMVQCKRLCDQHVLRYEPQTGDCICQKPRGK